GIIAGQATLWYTSQFYSLYFLTQTMKVDALSATLMLGVAVALAAPFNVLFGALSDKVGRKPLIIGGCLLAALLYFPIFQGLAHFANPALDNARHSAPVQVTADASTCSFQFNPVGASDFTTSCDIAKSILARHHINYENVAAPAGTNASVSVGGVVIDSFDGASMTAEQRIERMAAFEAQVLDAVRAAGYPMEADPASMNKVMIVALLF